ncbi:MAG: hypothetical protein M1816_003518 [Peltula sp. TS41687]|nr:MAG: hypothetical protein M1816_003518 [Peltula sp. TS41687]
MSAFPNYEFQNQQGAEDPSANPGQVPQQQQAPSMAQASESGPASFQGGGADPGSAGGPSAGGDAKTTLCSNAGYCFVDFSSPAAAAKALTLNGTMIPNSTRPFKLNWASGGGLADRRDDRGPEYSIFVGDLGPEVNEYVLVSLFQSRFPSCKSAKIMTDPISGMSRGYGFVRFSEEGDQQRALTEMQGVYCGNRPMRISTATPKNKAAGAGPGMGMPMGGNGPVGMYSMGAPPMGYYGAPQPMNQFTDPNNTTVFVGGLSGYVTEDELRSFFQGFGEITYVKIPPGKGCGFVQFVQRHAAEMAINQMQGYPIGNSRVRLSWGRSQNNSGPAGTPYRPAPPPPVYPSMVRAFSFFYVAVGSFNSPHAAHMHPPPMPGTLPPSGLPGVLPADTPGVTESVPVNRLNEMYMAQRQAVSDRLEADFRGYHSVFSQ